MIPGTHDFLPLLRERRQIDSKALSIDVDLLWDNPISQMRQDGRQVPRQDKLRKDRFALVTQEPRQSKHRR